MQNVLITTKSSLANLTTQAGNVKQSGYALTAATIMAYVSFGEDRQDDAREAVRNAFLSSGFVKMDKGTKQPSDKARRFIKCAEAAYANHADKVRSLMVGKSVEQQTASLAQWISTFALSGNDYAGGVYLICLTLNITKKDANERIAALNAKQQAVNDNDVKKLPAAMPATKGKKQPEPDARAILTTAATVDSILGSLRAVVRVKKGEKPSKVTAAAVVRLMSELDNVCRLVRGETVASASKDAKQLAVEVAKHLQAFKVNARKEHKAKDAIATKAEKKAA